MVGRGDLRLFFLVVFYLASSIFLILFFSAVHTLSPVYWTWASVGMTHCLEMFIQSPLMIDERVGLSFDSTAILQNGIMTERGVGRYPISA